MQWSAAALLLLFSGEAGERASGGALASQAARAKAEAAALRQAAEAEKARALASEQRRKAEEAAQVAQQAAAEAALQAAEQALALAPLGAPQARAARAALAAEALGAHRSAEAEAQASAVRAAEAAEASGSSAAILEDLAKRAAELERLAARKAEAAAAARKAAAKRPAAKARSKRPVLAGASILEGARLVSAFGDSEAGGPRAKGATLTGPAGAAVRAPAAGVVHHTSVLPGVGQVLIMDVGSGQVLVFAGLGVVSAGPGHHLGKGDRIGALPTQADSRLYIEVRNRGERIDPLAWLAGR